MGQQKELSCYEQQRIKNIEDNKKMLESLGLLRTFKPILNPLVKKKPVFQNKTKPQVKRKFVEIQNEQEKDTGKYLRRRSLRIKGVDPDGSIVVPEDDDEEYRPKPKKISQENYFGAPDPAFYIGYHWETRMECSSDGIHRPTVAGIHGNESVGCYSIALSGGYEDDLDYGESFTFTGSGGRDLKGTKSNPKNLRTAPQSKDQTLEKMNLALSRNVESRQPVRVIRGYKLQSPFAPEYGYRYDGLYTVEKCWACTGLSGFQVYKYVLKRIQDQPPPPWKEVDVDGNKENIDPNNNNILPNTLDGVKGLQTEIDISKDVEIKESGEENKEPDAKGTKESEDSDACLKENIKENETDKEEIKVEANEDEKMEEESKELIEPKENKNSMKEE